MDEKEKIEVEQELLHEEDFSEEELADETIDWKAKALELKGLNKRRATKLGKLKEAYSRATPTPAPSPEPVKKGLDYAELAYLEAKGISQDEDQSFIYQEVQSTGKPLKEIVGFKYIQEELQKRKDARVTQEAMPPSSNRSGQSAKDSVDYWRGQIDSGKAKLSDISDPVLRHKVNNAKIQTETQSSKFASDSVIIG